MEYCIFLQLLWGYVSGVEDHGCVISFGIKGMTGFIPSKDQGITAQNFQIIFIGSQSFLQAAVVEKILPPLK